LLAALAVVPPAYAPRAEAFIYSSRGDGINRANVDGSGVDQLFIASAKDRVGDLAVEANHIYWTTGYDQETDESASLIARANLDGTGVDTSFISDAGNPVGIAADADHIYWANGTSIGRANLDGSGVEPAFVAGVTADSVAVDADFIYWTSDGPGSSDTIGRVRGDGTDVDKSFISAGDLAIGDVAVDANHVYWIHRLPYASLIGADTAIGRADLDGTDANPAFIPEARARDLALDPQYIYWAWDTRWSDSIARSTLGGVGDGGILNVSEVVDGVAVDGHVDTVVAGRCRAPGTEKQRPNRIRISFKVKAREPLTVKATGTVEPDYELKRKTVKIVESTPNATSADFIDTPVQTKTLKLKPRKKAQAKIAATLKRGEKAKVKVKVKLTDAAGNIQTEKLRVKLKS
jgi:hypothetical protein